MDPLFGYPTVVRFSWATCGNILDASAMDVRWYIATLSCCLFVCLVTVILGEIIIHTQTPWQRDKTNVYGGSIVATHTCTPTNTKHTHTHTRTYTHTHTGQMMMSRRLLWDAQKSTNSLLLNQRIYQRKDIDISQKEDSNLYLTFDRIWYSVRVSYGSISQ